MNRQLILIAHNVRSTHNVGSLLRTADGLGVACVFLTGYTPYPTYPNDRRLPHLAAKLHRQIIKTALGAETSQRWQHYQRLTWLLLALKILGYELVALEQGTQAVRLPEFQAPPKIALLIGREVEGLEPEILGLMDAIVEIPMFGQKESFNVVQAAAMALFYLRFM